MSNIIQVGLTAAVEINYVRLLINSMKLLASNPENLEFIVGIDTGPGKGNFNEELFKDCTLIYHDTKLPYSSQAHGILMDKLLGIFNKKYGMLVDSDVCFLHL